VALSGFRKKGAEKEIAVGDAEGRARASWLPETWCGIHCESGTLVSADRVSLGAQSRIVRRDGDPTVPHYYKESPANIAIVLTHAEMAR